MTTRCNCTNLTNGLKCKKKGNYTTFNNKKFCTLHYKYYYTKYIKRIQHAFRTYKMKRAINIFKKLPRDLQCKIIYVINLPLLIKIHHYDVIDKILYNKIFDISNNTKNLPTINSLFQEYDKLLSLLIKYFNVLSNKTHCIVSQTLYTLCLIIIDYRYNNSDYWANNIISNNLIYKNFANKLEYYSSIVKNYKLNYFHECTYLKYSKLFNLVYIITNYNYLELYNFN